MSLERNLHASLDRVLDAILGTKELTPWDVALCNPLLPRRLVDLVVVLALVASAVAIGKRERGATDRLGHCNIHMTLVDGISGGDHVVCAQRGIRADRVLAAESYPCERIDCALVVLLVKDLCSDVSQIFVDVGRSLTKCSGVLVVAILVIHTSNPGIERAIVPVESP